MTSANRDVYNKIFIDFSVRNILYLGEILLKKLQTEILLSLIVRLSSKRC